jgi:hypothetical protein
MKGRAPTKRRALSLGTSRESAGRTGVWLLHPLT